MHYRILQVVVYIIIWLNVDTWITKLLKLYVMIIFAMSSSIFGYIMPGTLAFS